MIGIIFKNQLGKTVQKNVVRKEDLLGEVPAVGDNICFGDHSITGSNFIVKEIIREYCREKKELKNIIVKIA